MLPITESNGRHTSYYLILGGKILHYIPASSIPSTSNYQEKQLTYMFIQFIHHLSRDPKKKSNYPKMQIFEGGLTKPPQKDKIIIYF